MPYAGFDSLEYPGDDVMTRLLAQSNLKWCGFYLAPAPSRPNSSWMAKYQILKTIGWGLAPIYVGQQQAGNRVALHPSAAQGQVDANDAVALAATAGFPQRSVIYLDIETGGPLSVPMMDYIRAWVENVIAQGCRAGLYCSYLVAPALAALDPRSVFWVWHLNQGNGPFQPPFPSPDPSRSGFPTAIVWQLAQNAAATVNGATLQVDLDVATIPDPSLP
jgi:hypothetical protein